MSSRLIVEVIQSEEILLALASPEDRVYVKQFGSAKRRCEVLTWRAMVRRELGDEVAISHDEYGAPQVDTPNIYISISHSRDRVALHISDSPCAVDIEDTTRNFRNVSSKYLSRTEQLLAERYDLFAEMWCAKEALYKYYKKGVLDLVNDMVISDFLPQENILKARILDGETLEVRIKREGNLAIALID
jgi:phosphopantetheinyl transferase